MLLIEVDSMGAIPAQGIAQRTVESQVLIKNIFAFFLSHQSEADSSWPADMNDITSMQANDQTLYERYAYYLTCTCESSRGGA